MTDSERLAIAIKALYQIANEPNNNDFYLNHMAQDALESIAPPDTPKTEVKFPTKDGAQKAAAVFESSMTRAAQPDAAADKSLSSDAPKPRNSIKGAFQSCTINEVKTRVNYVREVLETPQETVPEFPYAEFVEEFGEDAPMLTGNVAGWTWNRAWAKAMAVRGAK